MVVQRIETSVSLPRGLFTELRPTTLPLVRIHRIVNDLGPKFGKSPYGSPAFETASPIGEYNRKDLIDWMLSLPEGEGYRLFRESYNLRQISDDAATHKALERMYIGPRPEEDPDKFLWARLFIENIHNSMAARNRLRIVKLEFAASMDELLRYEGDEINVLSIAAGSSRGIMEVLAELNGQGYNRMRLQMVDVNREALEDGESLVNELGIKEVVEFTRATYASYRRYLPEGYVPDFVEIVGLLDYLPADRIEALLSVLRDRLSEGGVILYSNIAPNGEEDFTHKVVGWPEMHYRTTRVLTDFAERAGFTGRNVRVIREPLGVYNLVVARK